MVKQQWRLSILTVLSIVCALSSQTLFSARNDYGQTAAEIAMQAVGDANGAMKTAEDAAQKASKVKKELNAVASAVETCKKQVDVAIQDGVKKAAKAVQQEIKQELRDLLTLAKTYADAAADTSRATHHELMANKQVRDAILTDHNNKIKALEAEYRRERQEMAEQVKADFRKANEDNTRWAEAEKDRCDVERRRKAKIDEDAAHKARADYAGEVTRKNNEQMAKLTHKNNLELEAQRAKSAKEEKIAEIEAKKRLGELDNDRASQERIEKTRAELEAQATTEVGKIAAVQNAQAATEIGKAQAQASVDRLEVYSKFLSDPQKMAVATTAIAAAAAGIYFAKHGAPAFVSYLVQPSVVSETSKKSYFGWKQPKNNLNINDLTFTPALQKQLFDLAAQVQTAHKYDENLPNVMFYGPPGTGKTAFAKALAYSSGLDYALTSGSEFAKITDLNIANKELRKLLNWAQTANSKGLIVFIDEAESLFANRKLPSTTKRVQDFINTFLALIPEKSQKKMMFIFATNHPFKLDDAIVNRIGTSIEFTVPEQAEREKILAKYLVDFANQNKDAAVKLAPAILSNLPAYAQRLASLSPRAIKYVAEQMIIRARRQKPALLDHDVASIVLDEAKVSVQQAEAWAREREVWVNDQLRAAAAA